MGTQLQFTRWEAMHAMNSTCKMLYSHFRLCFIDIIGLHPQVWGGQPLKYEVANKVAKHSKTDEQLKPSTWGMNLEGTSVQWLRLMQQCFT